MILKGYTSVSAPAVEPALLADALTFMRIDDTAEIPLVSGLLATAREVVELYTGRALISQQWKLTMPTFEDGYERRTATGEYALNRRAVWESWTRANGVENAVQLELSPLLSVEYVKYYDETETLQTFASSNYYVLTHLTPGLVALKSTASWPAVFDRPDAVQITFTAGHATGAAGVPPTLRTAALMLAKHFYDNGRDAVNVGNIVNEVPFTVRHLLDSKKTGGWSA